MNRRRGIWAGCLLGILVISAPVVAGEIRQKAAAARQACPMQQQQPEAVTPPADGTQRLKRYMYLMAACVECPDNLHARVRALSLQH